MGKRTKLYLVLTLSFFLLILIFLMWKSLSTVSYKPLDKCFIASVSKVQLCSASASYTPYSEISPYLIEAVVTSEDDKFFAHNGVDWKELRKSMWLNLKHFSYKRGGSTITQQLVKNAYLSQEKSISRKIKEISISYDIENKYPKKLILEKYLNAIEYGKNLWGIKKAAAFYFNKSPSDLGVLESLYLTILLPSPVKYSQSFKEKKLTPYQKRRIKILLNRMKRKGVVDSDYAKFLIEDIDGFPWSLESTDFSEKLQVKDLSDPNINFESEEKELSEDEVIQKFLEENEDQD